MHLYFVAVFVLVSLALEQAKFVLGGDAKDVYFIYGRPGDGSRNAGLYGGNFNPSKSPNDLNLEQTHIDRADLGRVGLTGFPVTGLSYDPISKKVLIQFSDFHGSLAKIDPCINKRIDEDLYFYGISSFDLQTGPFALYDSNVYFVAKTSRIKDRDVMLSLTIRKMTGCYDREHTFMMKDGYDDRNCSVEVAKVLEEAIFTMDGLTPGIARETSEFVRIIGSTLSVVNYENKLHFLVQVAKPLFSEGEQEYALRLYETTEGGEAQLLHAASVSSKWSYESIDNIGDIAYKDGLLCWSAYESLFCGKWSIKGNVSEVHEVIKPGDARSVCSVSSSRFQKYRDTLTGIEIVSAKDKINIIFGCWASWLGHGGAGYLTANSDWSNIQMKKISDKEGPIRAGKMAIIDACPASSRREVVTEFDAFL